MSRVQSLESKVTRVCDSLRSQFSRYDIECAGWDRPSLKKFLASSAPLQQRVLKQLAMYEDCLPNSKTWDREAQQECLRNVCHALHLHMTDEFEEKIGADDVVEIYDQNFFQLFRNPPFFQHCSYTILDLALAEWFELYERPKFITEILLNLGSQLLNDGGVQKMSLDRHLLKERFSRKRLGILVSMKCVAASRPCRSRPKGGIFYCYSAATMPAEKNLSRVHIL